MQNRLNKSRNGRMSVPRVLKYPSGNQLINRDTSVTVHGSWFTSAWITSSTGGPSFMSSFVQLQSFNGYADYVNMFDQYRFKKVEYTLLPQISVSDSTSLNAGLLTTVIDYDDVASTSMAQMLSFENAVTKRGFEKQVRVFKPRIAMGAYAGAFTSFANINDVWIDTASTTVQHYGFKAIWNTTSVGVAADLLVRAEIQLRGKRNL